MLNLCSSVASDFAVSKVLKTSSWPPKAATTLEGDERISTGGRLASAIAVVPMCLQFLPAKRGPCSPLMVHQESFYVGVTPGRSQLRPQDRRTARYCGRNEYVI